MKKLEVRCCCVPQKLLGWLPVSDERAASVTYPMITPAAGFDRPAVEFITLPIAKFGLAYATVDPRSLELVPKMDTHRAIKAEGVSIETLRRIPGFIEASKP